MAAFEKQPVRDHIFHEITRSLCPECRRDSGGFHQGVVDAQVLIRNGAVYLRKWCPEHGWHEALFASDAGWYLDDVTIQSGCPRLEVSTDAALLAACPAGQFVYTIDVANVQAAADTITPMLDSTWPASVAPATRTLESPNSSLMIVWVSKVSLPNRFPASRSSALPS